MQRQKATPRRFDPVRRKAIEIVMRRFPDQLMGCWAPEIPVDLVGRLGLW